MAVSENHEIFSDSEPETLDTDWKEDPNADFEGDRQAAILSLRAEKKPIPRKLRTHNLLLTENFCAHWLPSDGVRELVQNFLDGICTAFNVTLDSVVFKHRVQGGRDKKSWVDTWTATGDKGFDKSMEYGHIRYDRKKHFLVLVNQEVELPQSVLLYGKTDKRNRLDLIGGFGEGMKIGILRLASIGCNVRYRTGAEIWNFGMRKSRGSADETLHYITSDSTKQRSSLEVRVSDIFDKDFKLMSYLSLSRDVQSPVKGSMCRAGFLVEAPNNPDLRAKRVYVKGLFVYSNHDLCVSVNFAKATVNRDRRICMIDRDFKKTLAQIWGSVFAAEKSGQERPYTDKFLGIAKNETTSVEFQCMAFMTNRDAECLYKEILRQTPKAFPFKRGAEAEEKLISGSLRKQPYPVHEEFLQLLSKIPQVMSVFDAQEKAFLSESCESAPFVYDLPLATMIKSYTSKIIGPRRTIHVKYHKCASDIDALLKEEQLICNQTLVEIEFQSLEQAIRAKLRALRSVERELRKILDQPERGAVYFTTMEYVASAEFRTFLSPPDPSVSLPFTEDSGGNNNSGHEVGSADVEGPSLVGAKRRLEADRESQANESSTGSQDSASKKRKGTPRAMGNIEGSKNQEDDYGQESDNYIPVENVQNHEQEEHSGRATITDRQAPNAQRMQFVLGRYNVELTHKVIRTPAFAVQQTFTNAGAGDEDNRKVSLNLSSIFPCCKTPKGDVVFTTSIQKQSM